MNVMIDLETLDTAPSTVILSIGIVAYDDKDILEKFYAVPSMQHQITAGRTISASTLQWWMNQNKHAKKVFEEQKTPENFDRAMDNARKFIQAYPDAKIWSYGGNFDIPIVQHALEMLGLTVPWKYGNVRCFRTWCDDHGRYSSNLATHNALQDAEDQAMHMINTLRREKEKLALEIAHEGN